MSTALERLSKINNSESYISWQSDNGMFRQILDIQEVVALAKANKHPAIDIMRFEAAKNAMASLIINNADLLESELIECAFVYADKLMYKLQNISHDNTTT